MAEAESEEAVKLRSKASEMLKNPSSIALPASKEPKSPYFLTKSLAEMVNEDPIRLQNQSRAIREEFVKIMDGEMLVYSSLARLHTFSIGLSSNQGEDPPPRAPLRESSVDPKDKSPPRYFQMPALGASVLVGERDGFDTIACHLFAQSYLASEFHLDPENAAVRSFYKDDHPGGLRDWLRAHPGELRRSEGYFKVILSGTELFVDSSVLYCGAITVGNLGGKCSSVSGSSSDYKDCPGNETIRPPSDVVEQPEDPVPSVHHNFGSDPWRTFEKPYLCRSIKGSYLKKPIFLKKKDRRSEYNPSKGDTLQLTTFDDFVILGNEYFTILLPPREVIDIVQKNASETVDVIAAQLVKAATKQVWRSFSYPITAIVIFLDHKEIVLREHKKEKKENVAARYKAVLLGLKGISQSTILKDDKKIAELKEEEKIFASKREDKKGFTMEEHKLGMKSTAISSNLTNAEMQNDSKASSSVVLIEDDCKNQDFMVSCQITKWIIYGDLLERIVLCFFCIEEMQYEFYFEDHENMAVIIGLGVPRSKVILECGSSHVIVVEIQEEDWDVVWAHSNVIPLSILEGNILKQEQFPDILHRIANVINIDNIVSKANNGGVGEDNGKDKAQGNANDDKGKGKAYDNHGNIGHPNGRFNGARDDNDNKGRKGKDGNDDKNDGRDQDDGKTSNDCKEVQAKVHLRFLPGGVLENKGKNKELGEIHKEDVEGKEKELGEVHEEEVEEKKKELGEGYKRVEKKKKKNLKALWHALKGGENGNVVGNQENSTTIKGVENGDVDENLQKQLENQIHSQMVFTFTIKDESGGPLKTIQATIGPITFQFPSNNEDNYLQRRQFGWFHENLQVAFGVVNAQVAYLDAESCKVLDSSEVKEVNLQGISKGNAKTYTSAIKGKLGIKYVVNANGEYDFTNGSESKTTDEVHNSWETNKTFTKGGFSISEHTDLNIHQLKYSYLPLFPFNEKKFEVKDKGDCLRMYNLNPICQLQRVSCEGTWYPDHSENLEAYKLEASRELGMTRIYNLELEIEEEKQKGIQKVEKNMPMYFIQKLEKVVYLNHAMSHLTSSTTGVYRLQERQDPSDPSTTFFTRAQRKEELKWPSNDPLIDVKPKRNI